MYSLQWWLFSRFTQLGGVWWILSFWYYWWLVLWICLCIDHGIRWIYDLCCPSTELLRIKKDLDFSSLISRGRWSYLLWFILFMWPYIHLIIVLLIFHLPPISLNPRTFTSINSLLHVVVRLCPTYYMRRKILINTAGISISVDWPLRPITALGTFRRLYGASQSRSSIIHP